MKVFFDRGVVLVLGVIVGCWIAFSFYSEDPIFHVSRNSPLVDSSNTEIESSPARLDEEHTSPVDGIASGQLWVDPPPDKCLTPLPFDRAKAIAAGKPVVIAVLGDSFGDGIWAALYREFLNNPEYSIVQYSKVSTGLTMNGDMNLEKRVDEALSENNVDIFVVVIGANDNQGLMHEGKAHAKLSDGWVLVYRHRIESYVKHIEKSGAQIYWVGLPQMRSPKYNSDIESINLLAESEMRRLRVPYLRTAPTSVDSSGQYNQYYIDNKTGKRVLFRAKDGIHMSTAGYSYLIKPLVNRIKTCVSSARSNTPGVQEN